MDFKIGVQLYSVRNELEKDFESTLKEIKNMGFDGVEFAGLYGKTPSQIKTIVDDLGLTPISAHVPYNDLVSDLDNVLDSYSQIGCKYIVIPYLTEEYRPGQPKFDEVIENARVIAQKAKQKGLTLLYHNHDFEFEKIDGVYALDILYNKAPDLEVEPDTCWIKVAGEDPANYILKYPNRVPVVHIKDFYLSGGDKPLKLYDLIGIASNEDDKSSDAIFDFRAAGKGIQNIPSILDAAKKVGSEWLIVELDLPSKGTTPMECVKESITYLKTL